MRIPLFLMILFISLLAMDIELKAQCPSRIHIWEEVEKGNQVLNDDELIELFRYATYISTNNRFFG